MKMTTKIACANMKYHKSKNVIIGIAIFLTTLLLFIVPTIGINLINSEKACIKEIYPSWHALFREVDEETVTKLAAHHGVSEYGLRSDVGYMVAEDADIALYYFDEKGLELYNMELASGRLPEKENEIVVSKGILKQLGQHGNIGDTIRVPYQILRDGGLDHAQEKAFVITGFTLDTESNEELKAYSAFVSKAFLQKEVPAEQIQYRFLFQVYGGENKTTDAIEADINSLAAQFGIKENAIRTNDDYLWANYVDPAFVLAIVIIMLIIVVAGIITIYSIYYVSMGENIREYGRLKAIGATKRQIRQIVMKEGMAVAFIVIPIGLLVGTFTSKIVFETMLELYTDENIMVTTMRSILQENRLQLNHGWIYALTIGIALATVYLSLLKPMRTAAKISEIEALRFQDSQAVKSGKKYRRGYKNINVGRLVKIYLTGNRKKSGVTICSMAMTGIFLMVVATVISCADPAETSKIAILGQYEIRPDMEHGNKDHPEREWSSMQKKNPLTPELKEEIEQIEGIDSVESFSKIYCTSDSFADLHEGILGVPESFKEELEKGIIEGSVTYEDLLSGDKLIVDKNLIYWYPEIEVGDFLKVFVEDGDTVYEKQLEVAAIGDYTSGFNNWNYLIMAQEGVEKLSNHTLDFYYHIFAEEKYDEAVEKQLEEMVAESGLLNLRTWKDEYELSKSQMTVVSAACYAFLGILGAICIMNMINTMIHSVHVRKKEIGMLQAIGMSDAQVFRMLQIEGMFYTLGTLILTVGGGSLIGYPIFLWARENGILSIRNYYYPVEAVVIVVVVLSAVQLLLSFGLSKSVKKESLIERIRFSE